MLDGADHVVEVDPAHPLAAIAQPASDAHFEWRQHLVECATIGTENDANAHLHGADARRGGSDVDPFAAIRLLRSRANTPYWILCHQDVRLDQGPQADDLLAALIELEEIDPTWAVAGNAGGTADMRIVRRLVDRFGGSTLNQWQHS